MTPAFLRPLDISLCEGFDYLFPVDESEARLELQEVKLAEYDVLNSIIED